MTETTLGGNQLLSDWKSKQLKWKDEPYTIADEELMNSKITSQIKPNIDTADSLTVKPFEFRTFLLSKA